MSFSSMLRRIGSTVTVVRDTPDGQTRTDALASIQGRKGYFEIETDIDEGDLVEQTVPGGRLIVHRVIEVAHQIGPAHFQGNHIEATLEKARAQKATVASGRTAGIPSGSEVSVMQDSTRLRIIYLTAAPKADLRLDHEMREVRAAVRSATHRDMVDLEMLPAATGPDFLDGLTRFRPHVVHFSGHANETVLSFDSGDASVRSGVSMQATTFVKALDAVDQKPRLVLLNACKSEAQLEALTGVVSAAIGMSESIGDDAAIKFAARFYAAIAEGQSVRGALMLGRVDLEIRKIRDADLPTLKVAPGVDPASLFLLS